MACEAGKSSRELKELAVPWQFGQTLNHNRFFLDCQRLVSRHCDAGSQDIMMSEALQANSENPAKAECAIPPAEGGSHAAVADEVAGQEEEQDDSTYCHDDVEGGEEEQVENDVAVEDVE